MLFVSFLEVVSIGAIIPFLGIIVAPEAVFNNPFIQPLVNFLDITNPDQLIIPVTVIFLCLAIFSGIARLYLLWIQIHFSYKIGVDFNIKSYRQIIYQPFTGHLNSNTSNVVSAITSKVSAIPTNVIKPCLEIINSVVMLTIVVFVLATNMPLMLIYIIVGFLLIFAFFVLQTRKTLYKNSKKISVTLNSSVRVIQESLNGIRDVILNKSQESFCKIFKEVDIPLRYAQGNNQFIKQRPKLIIETLIIVITVGAIYFSSLDRATFIDLVPVFGLIVIAVQRLTPVFHRLFSGFATLQGSKKVIQDVLDILNKPNYQKISSQLNEIIPFDKEIKLDNISFRFSDFSPWVIKDLDLIITKGSVVGFVGVTGTGKSTLIDIIMGLLTSTSGQIFIDDMDLNERNLNSWQSNISHIPQSIFLFDATIAENIAFGIPYDSIDFDRVAFAAKNAQIFQDIELMNDGFDTIVGERGIRLSGGQCQRIAIARALYNKTSIIILDEATSALDSKTEDRVMDSILNMPQSITTIIIAHRPSTLKSADHIYELINGNLREVKYSEII